MGSGLSREYLEEALTAIKRLLPGWQYAVIRNAALPRAGGRAAHRSPEKKPPSTIQSLIFDKNRYSAAEAKAWAGKHGYESGKVDETGESFRLRQEEPGDFERFRTIELAPGVKAVIGVKGDGNVSKADKTGVIVGLWLPPEVAKVLAIEGGEKPEDMHITLAHLGDAAYLPPQAHEMCARELIKALANQKPLVGKISGVGRFDGEPGGEAVLYASPDVPGLSEFRERVVQAIKNCGLPVSEEHGFDPHITMAYVPRGIAADKAPQAQALPLEFRECKIAIGPVRLAIPFGATIPDLDRALGWLHEAEMLGRQAEGQIDPSLYATLSNAIVQAEGALMAHGEAMMPADWEAAYVDDLPDSAFLHMEAGDEKDKTRRHFPIYNAEGKLEPSRLRRAIALLPQAGSPANSDERMKLQEKARAMLDGMRKGWKPMPWGMEPNQDCACKVDLPEGALATQGPEGAAIMFVGAAPTPLDAARGEPLTGPAGAAFRDEYLSRIGVAKGDVAITHLVPVAFKHGEPTEIEISAWSAWVRAEIARVRPRAVVALGQVAKGALGDLAHFVLPHPAALQKGDKHGEVARKLRAIQKRLTSSQEGVTKSDKSIACAPIQGASGRSSSRAVTLGTSLAKDRSVLIQKADRAKQVVYGVVLDPYTIDTQNDWAPPAEIESTAHKWLAESRVVGLDHKGKAPAYPVESFMVPYPSPEDYAKAMRNEPHKAQRMKLGDQEVGSGAWVLGVKVEDPRLWSEVEKGSLDAFSIGGLSERTPVSRAAMPTVEFT